ncbi:MAG TPA: DJ-1/PfpI family protein [bacterium]|nr:DJ-1/PfpI family protein [bacterium]
MDTEKNMLMVIAPRDFRDEEYFITKQILEEGGIGIVTASTMMGECYGVNGKIAQAETDLIQVNTINFDGIIFVGGPGAEQLFEDRSVLALANDFFAEGKTVCAICSATVILARAGLISGKRVTGWNGAHRVLKEAGAEVVLEPIVQDGNIITGDGPDSSEEFGQAILDSLQ